MKQGLLQDPVHPYKALDDIMRQVWWQVGQRQDGTLVRIAAVNVWKLRKLRADAGCSRGHAKLGEEVVVVDESLPVMQNRWNTLSSMTCLPSPYGFLLHLDVRGNS